MQRANNTCTVTYLACRVPKQALAESKRALVAFESGTRQALANSHLGKNHSYIDLSL